MKDIFILKQPNGLYCVLNRSMSRIINHNLTDKELIYNYIEKMVADLRMDIRTASEFKDEYMEAIINATQEDSKKANIENIISSMKEPVRHNGNIGSYTVKMKFKTDYLKSDFMNQLRHSVLTEERLKKNTISIVSETHNSTEIFISGSADCCPLVSCRYDDRKTCHRYTDTTERNEYLFNIICTDNKIANNIGKMIKGQFEGVCDFINGKISIDVIDKMVIVLFDIESDYYPLFTLI